MSSAMRPGIVFAAVLLCLAAVASADPPGAQGPSDDPGSAAGGPDAVAPRPSGVRGYPSRGRLGIEVQPMTAELREFFSAPPDAGVLVVHAETGRAAQQAGIAVGDVLVSVSGEPIARPIDLIAAVARTPAGGTLAIELLHKGEKRSVEVSPEGDPIADFPRPGSWHGRSGDPNSSMLRGPHEFAPELMRRLDDIEQRLQKLEQAPAFKDRSDAGPPRAWNA